MDKRRQNGHSCGIQPFGNVNQMSAHFFIDYE